LRWLRTGNCRTSPWFEAELEHWGLFLGPMAELGGSLE
jgi:hypothetical protein